MHFHTPDEDWSIPVKTLGFINNNSWSLFPIVLLIIKKQLLVNIKRKFIKKKYCFEKVDKVTLNHARSQISL